MDEYVCVVQIVTNLAIKHYKTWFITVFYETHRHIIAMAMIFPYGTKRSDSVRFIKAPSAILDQVIPNQCFHFRNSYENAIDIVAMIQFMLHNHIVLDKGNIEIRTWDKW